MGIVRYAGNRMTGLSTDTKPTESSLIVGTTFQETNTDDLYIWTGSGWNVVASNIGTETLSNKTLQAPRITLSAVLMEDTTILFEGSTDDSNDTTLTVIDPTANRTVSLPDATGTVSLITGTETLTNKTLTSPVINTAISGSAFLDEDNFASNAADKVASQQSIKAYVLSQVPGSQNLFNTIAVSGQDNVVADSSTDTLTFAAGSGMTITTTAGSDTVTFTNSGTASLVGLSDTDVSSVGSAHVLIYDGSNSWDNKAVSGDVTMATTGAVTIAASAVENSMLAGSIANGKLANSSITVSDGSNTSAVALGGTVTFAATANETTVAESSGTVTIGLPNNVTIAGNLIVTGNSTVNGDTVTQNVATVSVEDPLMALASGNNAADAVDIGFYGLYDTSGSQDLYAGLFRDANDSGKWKLFKDLQAAPTTTVNISGTGYAVGTLVANIEGTATSAATLTTARDIGGVSFNGSASINLPGVNTAGTQNTSGSAATLTTPRAIGGVDFNGSAAINLPGVNTAGNQNTSGTATALSATLVVASGGTNTTSYTKGDILIASAGTTLTKLAVGTDDHVLTADASEATGVKWAATSGGASESFAIAMAVAL